MNWEGLSKEQKQKFLLAGIGGVFILYVLWRFVLGPALSGSGDTRAELETLQGQLALAEIAVNSEAVTDAKLAEADATLADITAANLPTGENPLSWVTRAVYAQARKVGVDIETVSEMSSSAGTTWDSKELAGYSFRPYGVRIDTTSGFEQICRLIKTLEESNPYIGVLGISIASRDGNPESHNISLVLEWPIWKDPTKAPQAPAKP